MKNSIQSQIITANLHFYPFCNMHCKYCFVPVTKQLSFSDWLSILPKLKSKFQRINFVGGEPTEAPYLIQLVEKAKELGFKTSIVTNGYNMITGKIDTDRLLASLDCVGISIDSVNDSTNYKIGRYVTKNGKINLITENQYLDLCNKIKKSGVSLKINTVISKLNINEKLNCFYERTGASRIKIFQCYKPNNDLKHNYDDLLITANDFAAYKSQSDYISLPVVFEDNEAMTSSYYMIGSDGCFWDNLTWKKSKSLTEITVEEALESIVFDVEKYNRRYA